MGVAAPLLAVSAVTGAYGAYQQSQAQKLQGKYEERAANLSAQQRETQAEDIKRRGDKASNVVRRNANAVRGSQRAAMGASGVDLNVGSAYQVQLDTETLGELDAMTVKNNAFREAWGYESDADMLRFQGSMARSASKQAAKQTLITGGLNFARDVASGAFYASQYKGSSPINQPAGSDKFNQNYSNKLRLDNPWGAS